jgi:hypothetical protein
MAAQIRDISIVGTIDSMKFEEVSPILPPLIAAGAPAAHMIFTTSLTFFPGGVDAQHFKGVDSAKAICASLASAAKLTASSWEVMFQSVGAGKTLDRLNMLIKKPIKNVLGQTVLDGGSEVNFITAPWSTPLKTALNIDETGREVENGSNGPQYAWTGIQAVSGGGSLTCNAWEDATTAFTAYMGRVNVAGAGDWMTGTTSTCEKANHLYCISVISDEEASATIDWSMTSASEFSP